MSGKKAYKEGVWEDGDFPSKVAFPSYFASSPFLPLSALFTLFAARLLPLLITNAMFSKLVSVVALAAAVAAIRAYCS